MIARLRANPRPVAVIALALGLIVAFVVVVAPLFNTSGVSSAELAGSLPTSAVLNRPLEVDLAIDNTGVSAIQPTCLKVDIAGGMRADYVIFQGVDRQTFRAGSACGGTLSGQEVISVRIFLTPTRTGPVHLALTPQAGARQVGPAVSTVVQVAAA